MSDVLVAGEIYVDLILSGSDTWPQPGEEYFATDLHRDLGGGAAITACGLASLGTRAAIFGIVGADYGDWIVERLRKKGVDTSQLRIEPDETTGITVAISTSEDRTFFTHRGANRRLTEVLLPCARHIHLACVPPCDFVSAHSTVSLDVGWHPEWLADPRSVEMLRSIDIFFPNRAEASLMTGETEPARILEQFRRAGAKTVALKLGSDGAAILRGGEIYFAAPHPVHPIDTTGAGDCFDAGFLHAWLNGESPESCLRIANICGALSTEAHGGIDGFPDRARIL